MLLDVHNKYDACRLKKQSAEVGCKFPMVMINIHIHVRFGGFVLE